MKNKALRIFILSILFLASCNDKKHNDDLKVKVNDSIRIEIPSYVKRNSDIKNQENLLKKAIKNNDEELYNFVSHDFILDENYEALFKYALLMANKNNFPEAHFHVFITLTNQSPVINFKKLDNKTKNIALYYLIKSKELGYKSAEYSLKEIFGENYKIEKSSFYLKEYSKLE